MVAQLCVAHGFTRAAEGVHLGEAGLNYGQCLLQGLVDLLANVMLGIGFAGLLLGGPGYVADAAQHEPGIRFALPPDVDAAVRLRVLVEPRQRAAGLRQNSR